MTRVTSHVFLHVYTFSNEVDILIRIFLALLFISQFFSEQEKARQGLLRCYFRKVKKKDKKKYIYIFLERYYSHYNYQGKQGQVIEDYEYQHETFRFNEIKTVFWTRVWHVESKVSSRSVLWCYVVEGGSRDGVCGNNYAYANIV